VLDPVAAQAGFWIADLPRTRLEFPERRRRIKTLHHQWNAGLVLIKEADFGVQLLQDLRQEKRISVRGMIPKDDKATRLLSVSHLIEGGQIAVPANAPWIADFQREVAVFPQGKHDEQVDSLSQFLRWHAAPRGTPRIKALYREAGKAYPRARPR
jgi:predicted phage terminase large subunit-like protein